MKQVLYCYLVVQTLLLSLSIVTVSKSRLVFTNAGFYIVGSGSMSPSLPSDSLIVTAKQSIYFKNDIITFVSSRPTDFPTLTHRIHSIGGNVYVTKGDANLGIDRSLVLPDQIIGKVVFDSLNLGRFYLFLKTKLGLSLLIFLPATLIVYLEIRKIARQIKILLNRSKAK